MSETLPKSEIAALYKLSKGESTASVAKEFQIPPQVLISANQGLNFQCGTTIIIPRFHGIMHKVLVGETIASICAEFEITQEEFFQKNSVSFVYAGMIVSV